jgi:hypothetical protein
LSQIKFRAKGKTTNGVNLPKVLLDGAPKAYIHSMTTTKHDPAKDLEFLQVHRKRLAANLNDKYPRQATDDDFAAVAAYLRLTGLDNASPDEIKGALLLLTRRQARAKRKLKRLAGDLAKKPR